MENMQTKNRQKDDLIRIREKKIYTVSAGFEPMIS